MEDDISAITMLPDPTGRFACDDERLHAEAVRKARSSRSRQTKKPVAESQGQMTIRGRFGPMIMTFNMVSLPQIEEHRLFDLARRQLQAIFFFQTYDHIKQRGGFWQGSFTPVAVAHKGDWGRSRLEWFERHTKDWDLRWASNGADGFHQVWIRKFDEVTSLWAWAMEWNRNYRLVGFFGDEDQLQRQIDQVAHEDVSVLNGDEGTTLATRREVPLAEGEDTLFDCFD